MPRAALRKAIEEIDNFDDRDDQRGSGLQRACESERIWLSRPHSKKFCPLSAVQPAIISVSANGHSLSTHCVSARKPELSPN